MNGLPGPSPMLLPPDVLAGFDLKATMSYAAVSAMALQGYDFFQTLEMEVKYIWNTHWTPFKCLYLFMKYLPFVDVSLLLIRDHAYMGASMCRVVNIASGCLFYLGIGAAELVLTLRTWALCGRPLWLSCTLLAFNVFMSIYQAVSLYYILDAVKFIDASSVFTSQCLPLLSPVTISILPNWLLSIVYDVLLCIILVIRALIEVNQRRVSRPVYLIYRDGIVYYIGFFVLILLLLLFKLRSSHDIIMTTTVILRVMQPLLATRVVLHARQQACDASLVDSHNVSTVIELEHQ